ncbi:MAG: nuclear transport factor 2 family protein [Lewinellaceae bacterium]|nr:nuclear transport factor 2 family protein [Lewinellaceae bacterium]
MRIKIFSVALLLGFLSSLSAQDIYLPVSSSSEAAKSQYFKAIQAAENANIPDFFDGMKAAVKTDPKFFMAYVNLAFGETAFGQYEKAAAFIKPALAIDPAGFNKNEQIHRKALEAWDKDPKADPAKYMEELTAAYPNTAEAYDLAGRSAKWLSKDPKAAVKHLLRMLELRPDFGGGYNSLGYTYMELGEMGKAKAAFEKYIALAPKEPNAYDSMADYYLTNKEYAKSVEFYDKAAAMGMGNAMAGADRARAGMKGNVAVVDGLYQAFTKGDVPAVLAVMDANIVWNEAEGFPYADQNPYLGPDAVLNGVFGRIGAEWEYFDLTDIQLHDMSDNMVLATLRYKAKHKTTGKVIDSQTAHLWTLWDNKIVAFQQFTDTKQAAEAVK